MSTIGSLEETVRVTPGGHEYDFCTCGCSWKLERCSRCFVDYKDLNIDALGDALELDKTNCAKIGCNNKGTMACSACRLVRYCSQDCQKSDWRRHKPTCKKPGNNGDSSSKTIRINIACAPNPDEIVDAYPIGTRLTLSMGKRENPRCKVVAFNLGKGPYADPLVKFDHNKYPGLFDESMCSYTLKHARSGEISTETCQEFHQRGWVVVSGPADGDDEADEDATTSAAGTAGSSAPVAVGGTAAATTTVEPVINIGFPSSPKFLLVTGFMFGKDDCFWCKGITPRLQAAGIPYEITDVDDGRASLIEKLKSTQFTACVIVGVGSAGANCMNTYFLSDVKAVLTSWVNAGGKLAMQGEGCLADLINSWFGKSWYFASYEREKNTISRSDVCDVPRTLRTALPASFSLKACSLENVEESSRLYSYNSNKVKLCTTAVSKIGAGRLVFTGDVNAEEATIAVIITMGTVAF